MIINKKITLIKYLSNTSTSIDNFINIKTVYSLINSSYKVWDKTSYSFGEEQDFYEFEYSKSYIIISENNSSYTIDTGTGVLNSVIVSNLKQADIYKGEDVAIENYPNITNAYKVSDSGDSWILWNKNGYNFGEEQDFYNFVDDELYILISSDVPYTLWGESNNNTIETATDLGEIYGYKKIENIFLGANEIDYFKFYLNRDGNAGSYVKINWPEPNGRRDLELNLKNQNGILIGSSRSTAGGLIGETLHLDGMPEGMYWLQVFSAQNGWPTPGYYDLTLKLGNYQPDRFEPNGNFENACYLGIFENKIFENLNVSQLNKDYFCFDIPSYLNENSNSYIDVLFETELGDIDIYLYDSGFNYLNGDDGQVDNARVQLSNLNPGRYYLEIEIFGFGNIFNNHYSIQFAKQQHVPIFDLSINQNSLIPNQENLYVISGTVSTVIGTPDKVVLSLGCNEYIVTQLGLGYDGNKTFTFPGLSQEIVGDNKEICVWATVNQNYNFVYENLQ